MTLGYIHEAEAEIVVGEILGGMATYSENWAAFGTSRVEFVVKDKWASERRKGLSFGWSLS